MSVLVYFMYEFRYVYRCFLNNGHGRLAATTRDVKDLMPSNMRSFNVFYAGVRHSGRNDSVAV